MAYVCGQLSNPNLITGLRTCNQWVEQSTNSFLPELTTANRDDLIIFFVSVFVVVFTVRMIRRLFGI